MTLTRIRHGATDITNLSLKIKFYAAISEEKKPSATVVKANDGNRFAVLYHVAQREMESGVWFHSSPTYNSGFTFMVLRLGVGGDLRAQDSCTGFAHAERRPGG